MMSSQTMQIFFQTSVCNMLPQDTVSSGIPIIAIAINIRSTEKKLFI